MLRRWRLASVVGVVTAAVVARFAYGTRSRSVDTPPQAAEAITYRHAARAIPETWATYPIVAHLDTTRVTSSVADQGMFNDVLVGTAPLGDVFARYEWDACTAGGSSCAGTPRTLHHLRFGTPDERGELEVRTDVRCAGTSPFEQSPEPRRSCDPASIALRRGADGQTFVVTMRDPDVEEKPVASFTRTPVTPAARAAARAAATNERFLLVGLAAALLVAAAAALLRAHRFVRQGGILSWREAHVASGIVEIPGESPVALALGEAESEAGSTVLVAPSFVLPPPTYREMPMIGRRSIFLGKRSEAALRARRIIAIALACFAGSIVTATIGLIAYR